MSRQGLRQGRRMARWLLIPSLGVLLSGAAEAKVTISFLAPARRTPAGEDLNEKLVKMFNERRNDIEVEYIPAGDDWVNKATVAMAGGNAPDVIAGWESFFRAWLETGQALPLDSYFDSRDLRDFVPSHLELFRVNGRLYALPFYTGVSGLFYNVDMFDRAGLTYPDETWTWDTLLQAAKKLTIQDGNGRTRQWGMDIELGWDRLVLWVWENGGRVIDEGKVVGNRLYLDEPKAIEAFQFQRDLIWEHRVAPVWPQLGMGPWDAFWRGDLLAMWQTGSWDVNATLLNAKAQWNVAVRPKGPAGRAASHTADGFMVYAKTKHPKEAVEFLRFLTSPEAERVMLVEGGLQPARRSLGLQYVTETAAAKRGYNLRPFIDSTAWARPAPLFTNQKGFNDNFWPMMEKIFYKNEISVRVGLQEVTRQINAILAQR